jgi:hypothetical protein
VIAERPKRRRAARPQPEPRIGASVVRSDSGITHRFQRSQTQLSEDPQQRAAEVARRPAAGASSPSYLVRWTHVQGTRATTRGRGTGHAPSSRVPIPRCFRGLGKNGGTVPWQRAVVSHLPRTVVVAVPESVRSSSRP